MPTDSRPLRDVLREVEVNNVGGFARATEQRLARELRALAPLLRILAAVSNGKFSGAAEAVETANALADELEAK